MIKLKIVVVVVNKFEKQYYCYWEKTNKIDLNGKIKNYKNFEKKTW